MYQSDQAPPEKASIPPRGSKHSRRVFWTLFVSAFCSMLGIGIIVPFLPSYALDVGADKLFYVGLIFSAMNISRLIFLPIMRREAESGRRDKKVILIEGLAFYIFISLGYVWAREPITLGIVRFFNGFAAAMVIPISMAIIGDLTPVMGEGREMGDFQMAIMAGFGCGPLIGGALNDLAGYSAAFGTMGFLNFIALMLVIFLLPGTKKIGLGNEPPKPRKAPPYREALGSKVVIGVLIFRFINAVGRGASFSFIPILADDPKLGLSDTQVGIIITSIALVVGLFSSVAGRLADRYSRVKMIVIGSIGFTVCITTMPFCNSFWSLFAAAIMSGVFGAIGIPAGAALSVVEGRKYGMVTIMTLFEMAMSFGLFFGPPMGGLFGDYAGLAAAFYFAAAFNVGGTVLFYFFLRNSEANIAPNDMKINDE